ncbi:hypothetical protein AB0I77_40830 [Streptomyces sp. NPDC050619]|uniref:hypothetical protein n=1 Tax=Streptomyces sp. NPDC050619 TaxID=3157214 RepID=UPI00341CD14C
MGIAELPYVDEHTTETVAGTEAVWRALNEVVEASFSSPHATVYARLVGCPDRTASGPRPLTKGSVFPGFRVTAATPNRSLTLEGSHRFSTYTLTLRLEDTPEGHTRVHAETRAAFPGASGTLYRALAIRTGFHTVGMRRLLAGVRRRAE